MWLKGEVTPLTSRHDPQNTIRVFKSSHHQPKTRHRRLMKCVCLQKTFPHNLQLPSAAARKESKIHCNISLPVFALGRGNKSHLFSAGEHSYNREAAALASAHAALLFFSRASFPARLASPLMNLLGLCGGGGGVVVVVGLGWWWKWGGGVGVGG